MVNNNLCKYYLNKLQIKQTIICGILSMPQNLYQVQS